MTANRVRRLAFLFVLASTAFGGGCRSVREINWDLKARENEPRDVWRDHDTQQQQLYQQTLQDANGLRDERARNEAEFQARNPGGKR